MHQVTYKEGLRSLGEERGRTGAPEPDRRKCWSARSVLQLRVDPDPVEDAGCLDCAPLFSSRGGGNRWGLYAPTHTYCTSHAPPMSLQRPCMNLQIPWHPYVHIHVRAPYHPCEPVYNPV